MTGSFWNDPAIILYLLIVVLVADSLWSLYLLLREILIVYDVPQVPEVLGPYLSQELFNKMRTYKLHKSWFIIVNTLFVVIICGCLELYFGFYAFVWRVAGKCVIWDWMKHEVCLSIIYVLLLSIYITIKSLPGHIYERWCITSLVKRPKPRWLHRILCDSLDTICSLLLMALVVSVVVLMVQFLGQYAFLGLYAAAVMLTVVVILLVPCIIDPFIGKRVPLENLALQADLEYLTARLRFPIRQVYIIRVRDQSVGSNAFFYGCCCLKRIVIFDTLLLNRGRHSPAQVPAEDQGKGLTNAQVVAVVAHELGHWKNGHFYKAIVMFQVHLLLTLLLFIICFPHGPIYQAVGFEPGIQPIIAGFIIIFGFVLTPYFTISNVLMLTMTRQFEYQADKFAFKLGHAIHLRQALLKLYADNLSFPISDGCYSSWHHTHPTMLHRLGRLEQLEASRS